jgi:hypothetical protein
MVFEKFFGPEESYWGWRCLFCGEIVDPLIVENRERLRNGMLWREHNS